MADPYREADRLQAVEAALREHTEQIGRLDKTTSALVRTVDNKLASENREGLVFLQWAGTLLLVALLLGGGTCATSELRAVHACREACGARGVATVQPNMGSSTFQCLCGSTPEVEPTP